MIPITALLAAGLAHVPVWVRFFWIYPVYVLVVFVTMGSGYIKEVLGFWKGHGSKLHHYLYDYHTGRYLARRRPYKGERGFDKGIAVSDRTGPDGRAVFWGGTTRRTRAIRNWTIVFVILTTFNCALADAIDTVRAVVFFLVFLLVVLAAVKVRTIRRKHTERLPIPARAIVTPRWKLNGPERKTVASEKDMLALEKPTLTSEVPNKVLATLLSDVMSCQAEEASRCLSIGSDGGSLRLPDPFPALQRQRDTVEEIIRSHTVGKVRFTWHTTTNPRALLWVPVVSGLPAVARFRDYIDQLEKLPPGEFGVGLTESKEVYVASHNGDLPWAVRSASAGTGKSTGFLVKAVQILHQDPTAELYCVDTKQISFEHIKGHPRVHLFDNPQSEMSQIWKVFYDIEAIIRERYTAVREKRARIDDFSHKWLLVDEGNDLSGHLKTYWNRHLRQRGDPSQPLIWSEAVAPILRLGRQARVRGEFMFQDVTDRALGGESLKAAFSTFGMAGWTKQQWERTVGAGPPPLRTGPGKILMVRGNEQTWVQGFYDEPEFLREYAYSRRSGK